MNNAGANPVIEMLGRRLRLAVIGGGPGSFIGGIHRMAARLDDRFELVAGSVSSDRERSQSAAASIGIDPGRAYGSAMELLNGESGRDDGADVVAIMTPNDTHREYSIAALERGFDVICDKPIGNSLEEALAVVAAVRESGAVFCLTHNYTGYPMVRQARAMVSGAELGKIRLVQVDYVQGWHSQLIEDPIPWRLDPQKAGPSLVLGDIGSHAHNLVRFITGLDVSEVSAEVGSSVPGRLADDYAGALIRLDNGARGTFWVTQAATGVENALRIRVSGESGTLEWEQEAPTVLHFKPSSGPAELRTVNGPGTLPLAARSTRIVAGHPEAFIEAFANLYSDAAEAIAARLSGHEPDPLALHFPTEVDGAKTMRFIEAMIDSSVNGGAWTSSSLRL